MADATTVVEGKVKYRDGKKVNHHELSIHLATIEKFNLFCTLSLQLILMYFFLGFFIFQWKSRWCVLKKPSPVAGKFWIFLLLGLGYDFTLRNLRFMDFVERLAEMMISVVFCLSVDIFLIMLFSQEKM